MSTILECVVDVCLPIAARWIVIQIGSFFGSDLNGSTFLWFITIVLCSIVAECFTFQPKRKLKPLKKKTPEVLTETSSVAEPDEEVEDTEERFADDMGPWECQDMGTWEGRDIELFPNEEHV